MTVALQLGSGIEGRRDASCPAREPFAKSLIRGRFPRADANCGNGMYSRYAGNVRVTNVCNNHAGDIKSSRTPEIPIKRASSAEILCREKRSVGR